MSTNRKGFLFGVIVVGLALAWSFLLYKMIEPLDRESLRATTVVLVGWLLPIVLVIGIAITRWVSVREVKAHERGMDKGLDKIAGMAERVATTRTTMVTNIKRPDAGWNAPAQSAGPVLDYLPRPQVTFKSHAAGDDEIEGM
jgi:heme/copper-type cytochrome/quinol oxidase subunit 2